jgi:hypothetical protein
VSCGKMKKRSLSGLSRRQRAIRLVLGSRTGSANRLTAALCRIALKSGCKWGFGLHFRRWRTAVRNLV